jgi:hypothetical protein
MNAYAVTAHGTEMGIFWGTTEEEALDSYARDAGYSSYEELASEQSDDAEATRLFK